MGEESIRQWNRHSCFVKVIYCSHDPEKSHNEHFAFRPDGSGWCLPMLGLTSSNRISAHSWKSADVTIEGPVLPGNVWTHLVTTYSQMNGLRLWVNGTLVNSSHVFTFVASGVSNTLTLGKFLPTANGCNSSSINPGQFYGAVDELRVYGRELNQTEISLLAQYWLTLTNTAWLIFQNCTFFDRSNRRNKNVSLSIRSDSSTLLIR